MYRELYTRVNAGVKIEKLVPRCHCDSKALKMQAFCVETKVPHGAAVPREEGGERKSNMDNIIAFDNPDFGQIRALEIDGEPWFVAADVCRALKIGNPSDALKRLDDDEKMILDLTDSHSGKRGGAQSISIINESGVYSLIFSSELPDAKKFKHWVTHDVLPSIVSK